jgi:hypothetical protein
MKKVLMGVLLLGLIAAVSATPVWAQGKKVDFSLNLGVQTNIWSGTSFDNAWFTLDARVGIPLGKMWEVSPELMYAVDDSFDFGFGWLYPGVLINFKSGGFFVGAGAVLPVVFGEGESDTMNISPKINLGYHFGKVKLTAYLIIFTESGLDFFDMNQAGVTIGYRF